MTEWPHSVLLSTEARFDAPDDEAKEMPRVTKVALELDICERMSKAESPPTELDDESTGAPRGATHAGDISPEADVVCDASDPRARTPASAPARAVASLAVASSQLRISPEDERDAVGARPASQLVVDSVWEETSDGRPENALAGVRLPLSHAATSASACSAEVPPATGLRNGTSDAERSHSEATVADATATTSPALPFPASPPEGPSMAAVAGTVSAVVSRALKA
mmetsp:Transcript_8327/g.27483  ORF Transcript_8327/g.27483 Transcript_8327/m.27483 type:complete len:226 (-) Transcript_8327:1418-2095(-)|eukprot:scaffold9912_cov96-Isochrysis_galbana.AAC.5